MVGRDLSSAGPGGVAQLVERYVRNVEAEGSSPFTSTRGQRYGAQPQMPTGEWSGTVLFVRRLRYDGITGECGKVP